MKRLLRRGAAVLLALTLLVSTASALTVDQALELLERIYVDEIPQAAYEAADLDELFDILGDPYTCYMTQADYQAFLDSLSGELNLAGIGVALTFTQEGLLITRVLDGGSAQAAGIREGDLIVQVDGTSCVPADESLQSLLAGPAGSTVQVTVLRPDGTQGIFVLTRRQVVIPSVEVEIVDGVGYVDCDRFSQDTGTLFAQGLAQYDGQADSWLVDLRDNAGGYTTAAVDALGAFAGPGYHLFLQDRGKEVYYYAYYQSAVTQDPLVVLVNENSASASEAFAAGVRDAGRGIVVGTRTYGKGVAQIICDQEEFGTYFSGDAMKITAYRFYSARGTTTDRIGVIPTLLVDDQYAAQVAAALCASTQGATDGRLMLQVDEQYFVLDPEELEPGVFAALLSALPPSAQLWLGRDTYYWDEITMDQAAQRWGVAYASRWFTDVSGSPYAHEINTLASYQLLLGSGDGAFLPETQLNRAQLCAMLAHLLGVSYTGASQFSDVADGAWYAQDVNAIASLGLIQGDGAGHFYPDQVLTQEQFIAILGRMARYLNFNVDGYALMLADMDLSKDTALAPFSPWAREGAAVLARSAQTVLGRSTSMLYADLEDLDPQAPTLREEAACTMYRMLWLMGVLPM